jgi:hypothetical protein
MKRKIFYVLLILVFGIRCTHLLNGVPKEEWDADNYGKVIGQIVDPETGDPVNEVFIIDFLDCNEIDTSINLLRRIRTNEKGFFSVDMKPFVYCLYFQPESKTSKYSFDPEPAFMEKYKSVVKVEKGKITRFRKVATMGGKLKIRLVDTTGRLINPQLEFPKRAEISIFVHSDNIVLPKSAANLSYDDDNMNDGEMIIHGLYPDTYSIEVDFSGLGFEGIKMENIQVEKNETTEVEVMVDPTDITGIEGTVLDKNGAIVKNVEVFLSPTFPIRGSFETFTDQNGNYRLTGLPEGLCHINVAIMRASLIFLQGTVEIKKNILLKKHIVLDWSPVEN